MSQTTIQILRCLTLGRYTAAVVEGELKIRGPQPLAGPLPASIKARRAEIIDFLEASCGGAWPPAKDSEFYELWDERESVGDSPREATGAAWDLDWAAEKAVKALRYLGRNAPEVLENTSVLEPHEEAAHQAAMRGDEVAYLEALRAYSRAGRDEALRIRKGAA
jgi:hypothetical protein